MAFNCDFSKALLLKDIYNHNLCEDYENRNICWYLKISERFKITKVEKVYNPQLLGMYLLCKEELKIENGYKVQEMVMYHATSTTNALSIAKHNIDWRRTFRSRFGIGACFSTTPGYAHRYSSSTGAFIVFKVLVKELEVVNVTYGLQVPSDINNDTVKSVSGSVYVKFDDNNFYPEFIVHYCN